jgi:hypothetical protein
MLHVDHAAPRVTQLSDAEVTHQLMQELRGTGVFDVPEPVRQYERGTQEFKEVARQYEMR